MSAPSSVWKIFSGANPSFKNVSVAYAERVRITVARSYSSLIRQGTTGSGRSHLRGSNRPLHPPGGPTFSCFRNPCATCHVGISSMLGNPASAAARRVRRLSPDQPWKKS